MAGFMTMDTTALIAALAYGIGLNLAGGLLTDVGDWYRSLRKPWFQPPGWAFAPAWTIILGLAGWALYLGWTSAQTPSQFNAVVITFGINAVLHFLWSPLFFTFKRPDWSFVENFALIASCAALIVVLAPISTLAAWLIVPYLVWTCFAQAINYAVVRLNGPFRKPAGA
jgi:tryptophan-rich sensory protein